MVINEDSIIEDGGEIGVGVVLGGRSPDPGGPHLEIDAIVHAGAKIVDSTHIGWGSVITANAVVISDIPLANLVAGVPGIVKCSDIAIEEYRATSRGKVRALWNVIVATPLGRGGRGGIDRIMDEVRDELVVAA